MMDLSQRKEQFSRVYVRAVATVAGFTVYQPEVDDDSIDLGITGRIAHDIPSRPRIELQLKCTGVKALRGDHIVYRLKLKNYDDLRLDDPIVPRLLVVVLVPGDESQWLRQTHEHLCLRRCAYWGSLRGMGESRALAKVSIRLTRQNLFSVEGLQSLMSRAGRREPL
jgi:hypothetical protein